MSTNLQAREGRRREKTRKFEGLLEMGKGPAPRFRELKESVYLPAEVREESGASYEYEHAYECGRRSDKDSSNN